MPTRIAWLTMAVLGTLTVSVSPSSGQTSGRGEEPVAGTFSGQIEVTAIELMIEVRRKDGRIPEDLTAADFEVWEDGRRMTVIGLEAPPRLADRAIGERLDPSAAPGRWRFVVYFDGSLTAPRSIARSARSLFRQAPELTALGSVELVLADPSPRVLLPFTRDAERLRETLDGLAGSFQGRDELLKIRRQFLTFRDMRIAVGAEVAAIEAIGQIRSAVQQEQQLVERQLTRFKNWIETYGSLPASAVILVSDGFDLDPGDFYLQAVTIPGVEQELATELIRYRVDRSSQELSRELAARGWTGIVLAAKGVPPPDAAVDASMAGRDRFRSIGESASASAGPGSGTPFSLLQHPVEPLLQVTRETGGEVLTNLRKTGRALERLRERFRLTYQADRPADGVRHRLEVRTLRPGLELRSPQWTSSPTAAQAARSRVRRLLALDPDGAAAGSSDLPVEARLAPEPAQDGPPRIRLSIFFDLNTLRPVLAEAGTPIRFTIGVALGDGASFVHQETRAVAVPALPRQLPRFEHTVALDMPAGIEAGRVAVVVEELASGSWGGHATEPDVGRPRASTQARR